MAFNINLAGIFAVPTSGEAANPAIAPNKTEAANPYEVKHIALTDIKPSESNFYVVADVTELKQSIELDGLQTPITVRANADGCYIIVSGHRRYKAFTELSGGENGARYKTIPAFIREYATAELEELSLIMANATARELTDWEKMRQTVRIKEILDALKTSGYQLNGRVREIIARMQGVSASQIGIYEAVNKHVIPELQDKLKDGELTVTAAYNLSKCTDAEQQAALDKINSGERIKVNDVTPVSVTNTETKSTDNGVSVTNTENATETDKPVTPTNSLAANLPPLTIAGADYSDGVTSCSFAAESFNGFGKKIMCYDKKHCGGCVVRKLAERLQMYEYPHGKEN